MKLAICPEEETRKVYEGPIRDGAWGQLTDRRYEVWQCVDNEIAFLHPFPDVDYTSAGYRESVNETADVGAYFNSYDRTQLLQLPLFSELITRGQTVADCGCGGGSMLDYLHGVAATTVAIEPLVLFHDSLRERGHQVFGDVGAAVDGGLGGAVDVAVSFHAIEHTLDPIEFLRGMFRLLRDGGSAYVHTPNYDDILMKLDFETFAPFNFRAAHNYYFTARSLVWLAERAGFEVDRIVHHQEFGLSNAFHWLRDKRPRGNEPIDGVARQADALWRSYCEETGQATNVGILLRKPT